MNYPLPFCKLFLGVFLVAMPVFSKQHGILEITSRNYHSLVIDGSKDAWIVAVKGAGKISTINWEDLEYNLRGLYVRVGIIDPNKDGAFLKKEVSTNRFWIKNTAVLCPFSALNHQHLRNNGSDEINETVVKRNCHRFSYRTGGSAGWDESWDVTHGALRDIPKDGYERQVEHWTTAQGVAGSNLAGPTLMDSKCHAAFVVFTLRLQMVRLSSLLGIRDEDLKTVQQEEANEVEISQKSHLNRNSYKSIGTLPGAGTWKCRYLRAVSGNSRGLCLGTSCIPYYSVSKL